MSTGVDAGSFLKLKLKIFPTWKKWSRTKTTIRSVYKIQENLFKLVMTTHWNQTIQTSISITSLKLLGVLEPSFFASLLEIHSVLRTENRNKGHSIFPKLRRGKYPCLFQKIINILANQKLSILSSHFLQRLKYSQLVADAYIIKWTYEYEDKFFCFLILAMQLR